MQMPERDPQAAAARGNVSQSIDVTELRPNGFEAQLKTPAAQRRAPISSNAASSRMIERFRIGFAPLADRFGRSISSAQYRAQIRLSKPAWRLSRTIIKGCAL
jgi:DNA primase